MEQLTDLKAILHSKRANIYYLQYCRVMQKDGRVLYLTEEDKQNSYYNIPIANTTCLLLGTGTSITQAAMRMLAQAGVMVGFSFFYFDVSRRTCGLEIVNQIQLWLLKVSRRTRGL